MRYPKAAAFFAVFVLALAVFAGGGVYLAAGRDGCAVSGEVLAGDRSYAESFSVTQRAVVDGHLLINAGYLSADSGPGWSMADTAPSRSRRPPSPSRTRTWTTRRAGAAARGIPRRSPCPSRRTSMTVWPPKLAAARAPKPRLRRWAVTQTASRCTLSPPAYPACPSWRLTDL